MAKSTKDLTPEQVVAQAGRPMGVDIDPHAVANQSGYGGTMVPHGHTTNGDPAILAAPQRSQSVVGENGGAHYKIGFGLDRPVDPAAGSTLANAKIIPRTNGYKDNFQGGGAY